jgi:anti-sigma regulatory factor (Ser/Thr protein kinase)
MGGRPNPRRAVRISYLHAKRMVLYRIADPGRGFKFAGFEHAAITHGEDPIETDCIRAKKRLRPDGFGLVLVKASVDELLYNEAQNEVVFVKYLDQGAQGREIRGASAIRQHRPVSWHAPDGRGCLVLW